MLLIRFSDYKNLLPFFENGHIYMNTIYYFHGLVNNNVRKDKYENLTYYSASPVKMKISSKEIGEIKLSVKNFKTNISNEVHNKFSHIFSMSYIVQEDNLSKGGKIFG